MRKDLLLELADFLQKLDPSRFDIRTWRRPDRKSVGFVSDEQLHSDCNTVACAVGWAATLPGWKKAGFYVGQLEVRAEDLSSAFSQPHTMSMIRWKGNPETDSYEAVRQGLDLYPRMAEVLFDYNNYADEEFTDPETVAERIREFCAASEAELQNLICSYDDQ
ncbi:hypothetical protein [Acinetobacter indicus]|uniref:Uncharacterized protein n=1 Tax=Acinetobacter indicus CIP 110367 TaxID=1341679 RepID=V2U6P3_9GAMM|nr:hypothetical protein [Acinetobacter indicus]EPF69346.1 hypothetical protein F956_02965 [Acinetobacter indicus ANC 4215]ESK45031.1 hypothetical protein P253_03063 [Acinetobacter indicus CIP 110367]